MKSISVGQQAALEAAHVVPVGFFEVDWASTGVQRYCTAGADIVWNTHTWQGRGQIVDISPIRETEAVEAVGYRLTLSGVPSSFVSGALQEPVQGRRLTMWLGLLDAAGALIGTPIGEFEGRMDTMPILDGETATITLNVESEMASLMGAAVRRYTDEDQRKVYPTDGFFRFVPTMTERLIVFPSAQAQGRR
jgi:hypothetical protein